jgi:hypothetical protein
MPTRSTNTTRNIEARKSSLPTIGKGIPHNSQGNDGDLTFRRTSDALMLYIKANHSWHGVKVGESFSSLENTIKDIKLKVDVMKQFRLPSTYSVTGDLTLNPSGDLIVSGVDMKIDATKKLYLDGGGDSYIVEHSADHVRHVVGGDVLVTMTENGDDGNQTYFVNSSAGFTQLEPTYNASTTEVDFRFSNKQNLTFGAGNITNVQLFFPNMSGNFVLVLKQDGTGSRTVTNWRAYASDETAAAGSTGAKWAGGSNPTLTTDANHVDILSFYWDNDNEIAYGVATLDFQF